MGIVTNASMAEENRRLFDALAEQLRGSLAQLNHGLQAMGTKYDENFNANLERLSRDTLAIIDGYVLCRDVQQQSLPLEPVALSAVAYDAAHELSKTASRHGCRVLLNVQGRPGPVLARKLELETAIEALGQSFLELALEQKLKNITLNVYPSRSGVAAGVFSPSQALSSDIYNRSKQVRGKTRQSLPQLSSQSGIGIYLADILLNKISLGLRSAKCKGELGLAATFMPSKQLNMV